MVTLAYHAHLNEILGLSMSSQETVVVAGSIIHSLNTALSAVLSELQIVKDHHISFQVTTFVS